MSGIHCIVAATDFSAYSGRVLQRAARIARQHAADLHLLHVVRPLDLYPDLAQALDELTQHDHDLEQAGQTRLDELAASLADQFSIRIRTATRLGRPHAEIAAYAQEVSADMVVVGARGESTLAELLLGSCVSRLLRVAACPVLIVKKPADEPYRQVLAAVDFSPVSAAVVSQAIALAEGARVDALYVLGSAVEQRLRRARIDLVDVTAWLEGLRTRAARQLDALLESLESTAAVGRLIQPGFPPATICQCIEAQHVDLVVLGRHGRGGGLPDWLLGSVSKDVAFAAACDVLLVHPID